MERHGIDQVIDELKQRGIQAGEDEASKILADARAKAEAIVADARKEADGIREAARQEREATLKALDAELAQATRVGLVAFRQAIEGAFVVPELDAALEATLSKPSFLENAILEIVKAFAATGMKSADLEVILPQSLKQQLGGFFRTKLVAKGAQGVDVRFDDGLRFGFKIGPKGGGFSYDLTEEGFQEILGRFLSPRFRKAFYAEAGEPDEK